MWISLEWLTDSPQRVLIFVGWPIRLVGAGAVVVGGIITRSDRNRLNQMYRQFIAASICMVVTVFATVPVQAQSSRLFGNPDAVSMQIDLLPEQQENIIRKRSGRAVPIAILGSATVDTGSINPRTIRLEGVGVMLVGKSDKSLCRQLDLNNDGFMDLLCEVRTTGFRVDEGDYVIRLRAETYAKNTLLGEDSLSIRP